MVIPQLELLRCVSEGLFSCLSGRTWNPSKDPSGGQFKKLHMDQYGRKESLRWWKREQEDSFPTGTFASELLNLGSELVDAVRRGVPWDAIRLVNVEGWFYSVVSAASASGSGCLVQHASAHQDLKGRELGDLDSLVSACFIRQNKMSNRSSHHESF